MSVTFSFFFFMRVDLLFFVRMSNINMYAAIPPTGGSIADDILALMLAPNILGESDSTLIVTPAESHSFLDFAIDPCSLRTEATPLLYKRPPLRHIFFAVGVSTATGKQDHSEGKTNGNHFVALHVDIACRTVCLWDSLPTNAVSLYIASCVPTLAVNIWGHSMSLRFLQGACAKQKPGSNDCAVFTWRMIATQLTAHQYVPIFREINVHVDDLCRDTFRCIYCLHYFP